MATLNNPEEAQALLNQVGTPYLAYEIAHALSPMCTSTDQFVYMKQIINETIEKHLKWLIEKHADTAVTTAASEHPNTTTEADENASDAQLEGSDGK